MVEVNNLTASIIDKKLLERVAMEVLEGEKEKNLSIALVGEERIKKLNRKYRKKNKPTDILSFGDLSISRYVRHNGAKDRQIDFSGGLGEVIICPKVVKKNAERYGTSFREEIIRVLVHGILHLLGYEHEKGREKAEKMAEREEYYLSRLEDYQRNENNSN